MDPGYIDHQRNPPGGYALLTRYVKTQAGLKVYAEAFLSIAKR